MSDIVIVACVAVSVASAVICYVTLKENSEVLFAIQKHLDEWRELIEDSNRVIFDD